MAHRAQAEGTRERLLEAAGKVFAEKGFRATTVRGVCKKAGANIAAVNYHFGGKNKLYAAVLSSIVRYAMTKYPPDLGQAEAETPEERLYAFVRGFLLRVLDPDQPAWHRKLLAIEMAQPSDAMRSAIESGIRQGHRLLHDILVELLGPRAGDECIDLCIASIAGQCLFYQRGRHMISRVLRHIEFTPDGVDKLARHIAKFSLNGVHGPRNAR